MNEAVYAPVKKERKPKYEGQRLTERYKRVYSLPAQEGNIRIFEDGTRYLVNEKSGTWTRDKSNG